MTQSIKQTFDAICLSDETIDGQKLCKHYPGRIANMLAKPGGIFLITSCNWTEQELMSTFVTEHTGQLVIFSSRWHKNPPEIRKTLLKISSFKIYVENLSDAWSSGHVRIFTSQVCDTIQRYLAHHSLLEGRKALRSQQLLSS